MFILQETISIDSATALASDVGYVGQTALDDSNGDAYVKLSTGWAKVRAGDGTPVAPPVTGSVTVQSSDGTITRALTAADGVVTLDDTDTIVADGDTFTLQDSDGTTSAGNAKLNSPTTASVAAGLVSAVKASA